MTTESNYQKATRQISHLSRKLANNLTFRKDFEDAITASAGTRVSEMRKVLKDNGITYPFRIFFTFGENRVQIWAPVVNPSTEKTVNVGFTYRLT